MIGARTAAALLLLGPGLGACEEEAPPAPPSSGHWENFAVPYSTCEAAPSLGLDEEARPVLVCPRTDPISLREHDLIVTWTGSEWSDGFIELLDGSWPSRCATPFLHRSGRLAVGCFGWGPQGAKLAVRDPPVGAWVEPTWPGAAGDELVDMVLTGWGYGVTALVRSAGGGWVRDWHGDWEGGSVWRWHDATPLAAASIGDGDLAPTYKGWVAAYEDNDLGGQVHIERSSGGVHTDVGAVGGVVGDLVRIDTPNYWDANPVVSVALRDAASGGRARILEGTLDALTDRGLATEGAVEELDVAVIASNAHLVYVASADSGAYVTRWFEGAWTPLPRLSPGAASLVQIADSEVRGPFVVYRDDADAGQPARVAMWGDPWVDLGFPITDPCLSTAISWDENSRRLTVAVVAATDSGPQIRAAQWEQQAPAWTELAYLPTASEEGSQIEVVDQGDYMVSVAHPVVPSVGGEPAPAVVRMGNGRWVFTDELAEDSIWRTALGPDGRVYVASRQFFETGMHLHVQHLRLPGRQRVHLPGLRLPLGLGRVGRLGGPRPQPPTPMPSLRLW